MAISQHVMNNVTNIDKNTFNVLKETLYPGSTDNEVNMILSYCKARRIDPILKPVHLVPMSVKTGKKDSSGKDIYERKNVIMPGIGLYRIDASRSGQYAGMSEPEFGEEVTEQIGSLKVTYPKWCKITVKKLLPNGEIAEFTAKEYWKENYASKSRSDKTPNEMWDKRGYGQIAKCTEAQALRKAFPDVVGNEYTKEEMEGKFFQDIQETNVKKSDSSNKIIEGETVNQQLLSDYEDSLNAIQNSQSIQQLQTVFDEIKKLNFKSQPDLFKKLIDAKDARKSELNMKEFHEEMNEETGEVVS